MLTANGGWRITIEVKTLDREIWRGIIEVSDVVRSGGELRGYRWVYEMAGMQS